MTRRRVVKNSSAPKAVLSSFNPKAIKKSNIIKVVNLNVTVTVSTTEDVIYEGEKVKFEGEQVVA